MRRALVVTGLGLLLVTGCATLEPPDVTLVDLSLDQITMLETSGKVTIRLSNANPEPLQVDGAAFDLYLDGRKVGEALSDARVEVPRLATATMEAALHLSHLAVATRIQSILKAETLDYRLHGKVWTIGGFGRKALRVERSGTIDLAGVGALDGVDVEIDTGDDEDGEGEGDGEGS